MKNTEEKRIYVIVPARIELTKGQFVEQPAGRQIAQACHVAAKIRHEQGLTTYSSRDGEVTLPCYDEITTIILQVRDSQELFHVMQLASKKLLPYTIFNDTNKQAYGEYQPITAAAVYTTPSKTGGVLDYLPLWGSK